MTKVPGPKKIKSAQRVLEVLEYFNQERHECTVMDIARSYGYPQSSTSELLNCLVALGYLRYDPWTRTYKPAARVAMLGAWIQPAFFRHGTLACLMDELSAELDETVVLFSRVGLAAQSIHGVVPRGGASSRTSTWGAGENASLLHSAPGQIILSTQRPDDIRKLIHRLNAESPDHLHVRYQDFIDRLEEVRGRGYAATWSDEEDTGMAGVLLPQQEDGELLALMVQARAGRIKARCEQFVQVMRGGIARHFAGRYGQSSQNIAPATRYA
ncbi:MAG: helix-turn-helix domain-containing protein [Sphingomonadales bacterium]